MSMCLKLASYSTDELLYWLQGSLSCSNQACRPFQAACTHSEEFRQLERLSCLLQTVQAALELVRAPV